MLKRYLFIVAIFITISVFWTLPALAEIMVDTAWVRRYNGTGNSTDEARSIAVDKSLNIYVTGASCGRGTYWDYATIRYYPNGDTVWVRTYNGPLNMDDQGFAVAIDGLGNVNVTGWSGALTDAIRDYATIKYYPDGDTAWVRTYDGSGCDNPTAIATDDSGNVYVTGNSERPLYYWDCATIRYYSNGDTAWIREYDGWENGNDGACDIAVDDSGYVYVVGGSQTSGSDYDYVTIKYQPNGDTAWVRRYNGPGDSTDWGTAIAVDDSGYIYVTGYSFGSGTDYDYATIKYYPYGDTVWVRRYSGPGNYFDQAAAVAVDNSGNVYVTGGSRGDETSDDYATIKYYPNGDTAWVLIYNGPADDVDGACAIAVDDSGSIYVTGGGYGSGHNYDYATIKYVRKDALRGDANGDAVINVSDVVYLINYLFISGPAPWPWQTADANCDCTINASDVVYLINYLFIGGPPPCEP